MTHFQSTEYRAHTVCTNEPQWKGLLPSSPTSPSSRIYPFSPISPSSKPVNVFDFLVDAEDADHPFVAPNESRRNRTDSVHMYQYCHELGCERLEAFTNFSDLRRHEREVHGLHGGPKYRFCPHKGCKRSTNPGFSRGEDLNERLRRAHHGIGITAERPNYPARCFDVPAPFRYQSPPQNQDKDRSKEGDEEHHSVMDLR